MTFIELSFKQVGNFNNVPLIDCGVFRKMEKYLKRRFGKPTKLLYSSEKPFQSGLLWKDIGDTSVTFLASYDTTASPFNLITLSLIIQNDELFGKSMKKVYSPPELAMIRKAVMYKTISVKGKRDKKEFGDIIAPKLRTLWKMKRKYLKLHGKNLDSEVFEIEMKVKPTGEISNLNLVESSYDSTLNSQILDSLSGLSLQGMGHPDDTSIATITLWKYPSTVTIDTSKIYGNDRRLPNGSIDLRGKCNPQ